MPLTVRHDVKCNSGAAGSELNVVAVRFIKKVSSEFPKKSEQIGAQLKGKLLQTVGAACKEAC